MRPRSVLEGWSEAVRCALHLQHESPPHAKQPGHRRSAAEGKHAAVEDGQAAERCEGCGGAAVWCGGAGVPCGRAVQNEELPERGGVEVAEGG